MAASWRSQDGRRRYRSQTLSASAGTVRRRCGLSRLPSGGHGWRGGIFWLRLQARSTTPSRPSSACTPPTPPRPTCPCGPGCRASRWPTSTPALYQRRTLVKHLAMRRTLWVVGVDDLPLIQAAASDRVADNERRKLVADVQKAGVAADGDGWLDRACDAVIWRISPSTARPPPGNCAKPCPNWRAPTTPPPESVGAETLPCPLGCSPCLSVRGDIVRGPNDGTWTTSRPRWAARDGLADRRRATRRRPNRLRAELVRTWLRTFGPGDCHRHQVVVRQHPDLGAACAARRRGRRGRPRRDAGFRAARRPREEPDARPVGRTAARPRRHHHGLVRPRLVPRRAPQPGVRHQRQRRTDGLVERSGGRRLGSGRRRDGSSCGCWTTSDATAARR